MTTIFTSLYGNKTTVHIRREQLHLKISIFIDNSSLYLDDIVFT